MDMHIKNKILKKIDDFEQIPVLSNYIKDLKIAIEKNDIELIMKNTLNIYSKGSGYENCKGEMRRHTIATAIISKYLDRFLPMDMKEDLFTACLLADIGKVILSEDVDAANYRISNLIKNKSVDFISAEKEVFGLSHAEIGAKILEKWGFDTEIVKAIRYHHEPDKVPESPLAHFISLSSTIAMLAGFTTGIEGLDYKGFPQLFKKYGIKQKDIQIILMESISEIKKIIPYKQSVKKEGRE